MTPNRVRESSELQRQPAKSVSRPVGGHYIVFSRGKSGDKSQLLAGTNDKALAK
jgi:hypothetical protein